MADSKFSLVPRAPSQPPPLQVLEERAAKAEALKQSLDLAIENRKREQLQKEKLTPVPPWKKAKPTVTQSQVHFPVADEWHDAEADAEWLEEESIDDWGLHQQDFCVAASSTVNPPPPPPAQKLVMPPPPPVAVARHIPKVIMPKIQPIVVPPKFCNGIPFKAPPSKTLTLCTVADDDEEVATSDAYQGDEEFMPIEELQETTTAIDELSCEDKHLQETLAAIFGQG